MKHDLNLNAAARAALHLQTKSDSDPLEILSKNFGDMADETLKKLKEQGETLDYVAEKVDAHEKKFAKSNPYNTEQSLGEQFIKGCKADLESLAGGNKGKAQLNVKNTLVNTVTSGGALDVPQRDSAVSLPRRRMTIRDLMNVTPISSGTVEYANQTTRVNNADTVPEGTLKPESDLAWDLQSTTAKVVAHWIKASRQILEDAPQIGSLIDNELRYGLNIKEEEQLLFGDGIGANLSGMVTNATAYADPISVASPTMLDTVGTGILQTALANFNPNGIVMHPSDWMRIRLLKDADGRYILGDPQASVSPNLFGLPVVATQAMTVDKFLVADFSEAATLYDRWTTRVEMGYVDADFTNNLVTILAEKRIALAVKQPLALTYGDFGNIA